MRLAIGCDLAGLPLKEVVREHLSFKGVDLVDFGVQFDQDVDYPDVGRAVAERVAAGEFDRAILICGTGIGMAIVANKVPGIRAAVCHDPYSAERARKSNNAQVMAMGARVIGPELAKSLTDIWLISEFEGGRSLPKVAKIEAMDAKHSLTPSGT
jgi:ribose 5-phosphate isomerase B